MQMYPIYLLRLAGSMRFYQHIINYIHVSDKCFPAARHLPGSGETALN